MNMLGCLSCIVSLIAAVIMYMYVTDLEKEQCECSKGWKRDVVKYLSIVFMVLNVLSILMNLGIFDSINNDFKKSLLFPLLSILYVLVTMVYLCITLVFYIDLTTHKGCGCSSGLKRNALLYPIIVFLIGLLIGAYNLVTNWPTILKQLAKGKSVKSGIITVTHTNKKTNKK
jgi:4-amino-4-deoxy-L-arabinose transferase-like glycosyltransferase